MPLLAGWPRITVAGAVTVNDERHLTTPATVAIRTAPAPRKTVPPPTPPEK